MARECKALAILLLDDEDVFRRGLAGTLEDDGHVVHGRSSPAELAIADVPHVDVVITDFEMPGEDGFRFADRFHEARPGVPVILLTAYTTRTIEAQSRARRYLVLRHKPIDYPGLHRLIHDLVA